MSQTLIEGMLVDSETGEIINEVEDVEVVVEENQLPEIFLKGGTRIQSNVKQLETSLKEHLKSFDIEVTPDTEKEATKKAIQLNKIAKELNSARLLVSKEIKKPADDLKIAVDNLILLVQEKRTDILEKVEVFKSARFDTIKDLLEFELLRLYTAHQIELEFQTIDIMPLVKEGSFGGKELTKKAKQELEAMVFKAKSIQASVKIRLLELDLKCQDLEVKLNRSDIESILYLDEIEYNDNLNTMISNRLELEYKLKQRGIEEQKRKEDEQKRYEEKQEFDKQQKTLEEQKVKEVKEKETCKKVVRVTAVFEVEVSVDKNDIDIMKGYREKLSSQYKSFVSIGLG